MSLEKEHHYIGADAVDPQAFANAGTKPLHRPSAHCEAQALAYLLFERPDLEAQKSFLEDFGMRVVSADADVMYLRGHGPSPWFYGCYKGEQARFLGFGFSLESRESLQKLASVHDKPIEVIDAPGGGERVRLDDPDGFIVDLVYGRELEERIPWREQHLQQNTPLDKPRVNGGVRSHAEPSPLEKLGHVVLAVTNFEESAHWYMENLGLIPTDVLCVKDGTPVMSFLRLDLGDTPADHHSLVVAQNIAPGFMHAAFETIDLDSIGQGNQYLHWKGRRHHWGIGRHILGSQLFDYWLDPWGAEMEHYTDGDVFTASHPTGYHPFSMGGMYTWGEDPPLGPKPGIWQLLKLVLSGQAAKLPASVRAMASVLSIPPRPWTK